MKRMFCCSVLVSFFLLWSAGSLLAAIHHVPGDYGTIQEAIDASSYGDTVMVAGGHYYEHLTLRSGVKVQGEGRDTTYLNGTHTGSVVTAVDVTNAEFSGFWVYFAGNGSAEAGIKISGGNLIISNNKISHNPRYGVYIVGESSAIIRNNIIWYNGDTNDQYTNYGLLTMHSSPLITNNLIYRNKEVGIYVAWADSDGTRIVNNTIVDNPYDGIWCYGGAPPVIKNNIIVSNGYGIAASHGAIPDISYNDVWNNGDNYNSQSGGVANPGTGDISEDPLFVNQNDFYLGSTSPCIDAGDPSPVYNDADGSRNDMGAYGGPDGYSSGYTGSPIESGFVFTNIGKIPVSEITQTGILQKGLANVSDEVATDLHIYRYKDAPFGGRLWISGLFGNEDSNVTHYQILVAKWNGSKPPFKGSFRPLTDPLTKIKYTINSDGTVSSQRVTLGPKTISGVDGLYERTSSGYWAHRDLKIIWDTTWMEDGLYDITYRAYSYRGFPFPSLTQLSLPLNEQDRITVRVDNSRVEAEIEMVMYDSGEDIPECGIISLGNNMENLRFRITARHPHGYLRNYYLKALYGTNHDGGVIASDHFAGVHDASPIWYGVSGHEFNSSDAMEASHLDPWENCAYQFHLRVWARTTDGFHHIRWADYNDHYYLQINANSCSGDLDGNGVVDGADLEEFSRDYGRTDCLE